MAFAFLSLGKGDLRSFLEAQLNPAGRLKMDGGPHLGLCRRFGPWWPSATACDGRRQAAVLPFCRVACTMSHQKPRKSVNQSQARLYPPQPRKPSGEWGCLQCTLERTVKSFSTSSVKWPVLMHADPRTHCSHCAWLNSAVRDDGGSTHAGRTFGEVKITCVKKKEKWNSWLKC